MLAGLAEYSSDGETERNGNGAQAAPAVDSEDDSYFVGSEDNSEDSALRRRREAERWLVDLEEATSVKAALPDPLAVLGAVAHRPRFLDPEATRPLAEPVHRGRLPLAAAEPAERPKGGRKRVPGEWDIASMAPPIKGTEETKLGVISAPAKRYRTDDRVGSGAVTAAQARARQLGPGVRLPVLAQKQVAMLGGQWAADASGEEPGGASTRIGPVAPKPAAAARPIAAKPSKAMGIAEFVDKGGGALLPRKKQDRAQKEKAKRMAGQSAIASWKSEAEMQQRQLYDS